MLPYVVVVVVVVKLSCSHSSSYAGADHVFPETLIFEGLGLTDVVNGSVSGNSNAITVAGDLNDALTTMNFHRYGHLYLSVTVYSYNLIV